MGKLKDKIYNSLVRKNGCVRYEYERYVMEHTVEHYEHRLLHWKILWKLTWHYRITKRQTPMLYWDKELSSTYGLNEQLKTVSEKPKIVNNSKETDKPKGVSDEKKPYLNGAESKLFNNKEAHYIAKDFLNYDVISFDVFDTLILRPFAKPMDLFYVVGEKLGIDSFRKIRMNAEAEAREEAIAVKGNREVTIYDIYRIINIYTGIDVEEGVRAELEVELDLCFANPQMKRVFNILKYQGKRIILTSDMYLSDEMIKQLLDKCGISGYEKIFVSCEYQCSKRTGGLYQNILNYLGSGVSLIHIGDNHETDYLKPKEYNIPSRFYKNVNKAGNTYRADGMSELIGSSYAGVVNAHLHNGIQKFSPHYEYGFIYGGLYIFGYCNWINQFVREKEIDKIIFLSRDGNIYKKIYDSFFGVVPSEYLHWSRVANMKYSLDEKHGKYYFMVRAINDRVDEELQKNPITIEQLLQILQLSELERYLDEEKIMADMVLTKDMEKVFKLFLHRHWDEIVSIYSRKENHIKKIILEKIGRSKKIAVVDVGWNGSGPLGIKFLIEEKWKIECKVECLLAGSKVADHVANINRLENGDLHTYMFSRMLNRDHYDKHRNTNKGLNSMFFEMFTQACEPSFSDISQNGEYIFEPPEVENYKMISDIHKGIYDFCKLYHDAFKKYPYLYNVSGYDAYCPFGMIIKDTAFIKKYMSDFVFARNVGNSINNFGFLKIREAFDRVKA